jgi:PEP-CTERM motif-containing protein
MTRGAFFVACAGVLCLGVVSPTSADPITITGGSIVFPQAAIVQAGPISIVGTRGFSIKGVIDTGENPRIDPIAQCFPCTPGIPFGLGAQLTGSGFIADATLDGQTYPNFGSAASNVFVSLELDGMTTLPDVKGSSIVITKPFVVNERSLFEVFDPGASVPLRGRGVVTLTLHANPSLPVWEFSQLRYDFQTPTPVPEPATLVLVGGGLVGLLRFRKRRTAPPDSR